MVLKSDGTKWACQSCLKGHRVSGCNHTDRELTLVPKKGRPVTQCQHCRLERKKRSAHVSCDCGQAEKVHHSKEKCIHLREAEERAKAGYHDEHTKKIDDDPYHLAAVAEEQGCCCHHGGKCACSIVKKESQLKDGTPPHGPAVHKPRLETQKSEGSLTHFANGHHKPVHKRNHAAHECGMPYKMPMPRAHADNSVATQARRSVDSLALDSNIPWRQTPVPFQPTPLFNTERRLSKSEQPSPTLTASGCCGDMAGAKLSPFNFSDLGLVQTNQSVDSAASDATGFPLDPMSSITDASFDPWSAFPSADSTMPNNNPFGAWPTTFDHSNVAQPALTAASSGTQSEVDELPNMDDLYGFPMPSIQEDAAAFNPDGTLPDSTNNNRRSLPPSFFGNPNFAAPMPPDWQTTAEFDVAMKPTANESGMGFPDFWDTPTISPMTGITQGNTSMPFNPGRPQSQSVGPGNAPNDDLIKQLFPEIDVNGDSFGQASNPSAVDTKRLGDLPVATSPATAIGPMDDSSGLTSPPWSDGSMSIPNDDFASPYSLHGDFTNTDFVGDWPLQ
ncbi:Copper resistance protein CRF1 [Fulvia fulva]|uniref:Copper resistance protein CRF1 n=1 Tax=Passalora fulva TaxID=5499 RepID=A0A9Q8P4F7_PASFU|nr:Copper resistance protein CRF1 [Fulvia fulva]KAK4636029.1 Copper resistance protein CRF1 [Fulvia fulva]KAK4638090.1 Copper resistance protein CRF1 [Fulvia fulva]UJO13035.1 Copper resistance protein CRF1 [Fulvia fulva]WPV10162.1 Copper resistance protein CRF1 [Fulvia fulva]WPV25312.1 Copper resistance protein CRF1 [Fulvia fulva]